MGLAHDRQIEAAVPGRARDLVDGPASRGEGHAGPEALPRVEARSAFGESFGGWSAAVGAGRRGGLPTLQGSVSRLQMAAGNAAVAGLLDQRASEARATRRVGPTLRHAGEVDGPGRASGSDSLRDAAEPAEGATPLADDEAMPAPTSSFTKVGPPSQSSYTVSGTLRQAAEAVGARKEAGATDMTPDLVAADNGTRMVHAQVTVDLAVVLPEWDGKAAATQNQRAEWDRFKAAITAHEAAHVEIDRTSFANAHTRILAKKTLAESYTEYETIITQADTANKVFDGDAHGRPATNINPNIDEVTKVP
ncbi:MAG: DUF922 domain-containing protein [Chloroflexota bacterium]